MSETTPRSVLERKLQAAAALRPRADGAEAWRRVLPRTAEDMLGLELAVVAAEVQETTLADALGAAGDGDLLIGLGSSGTPGGLAIVDGAFRVSLIEIQTTGRVSSSGFEQRAGTAADFALLSHVLDGWIAALAAASPEGGPPPRCIRFFPDARAVMLGLDDGPFTETRLELDFGGGRRKGVLRLVLPKGGVSSAHGPDLEALRAGLLPLPTQLDAVLCRVQIPLSRVLGLSGGDVIELGSASVRRITLEAPLGHVVSLAHLGQSRGFRAAKVRDRAKDDAREGGEGDFPELTRDVAPIASLQHQDLASPDPPDGAGDLPALPDVLPSALEDPI